jgi:Uncharacterized conserved protein
VLSSCDFKPVTLSDRDFFVQHYRRFPQRHSDNTFTNMVCWNYYANYRYAIVQDCVLLSSTIAGKTRYRPPIGPRNPDLLHEVLALALKSDETRPFVVLDQETLEWISGIYPELQFQPERMYFDYVYLANDLAHLPGKGYSTIRRQLNQFMKTCSPLVEELGTDNIEEINDFVEQWCEWKDCDSNPDLASEKDALCFALAHYRELELSGIAIRSEGKIGAISLFEGQNEDTALVHFEKGLPDCKGIYRAINAETAKILAKKIHLYQPGERYGCGGDPGGEDALSSSSYGPGAYARPGRAGEGGLTKLICRSSEPEGKVQMRERIIMGLELI